jgi:hypothetical protein
VDPEQTSQSHPSPDLQLFPKRRGLLLNSPRPSKFLPQNFPVALRTSPYESYHQLQADPTHTPRDCWVHDQTKSRVAGPPSLDRHLLARSFLGVTLGILQNNYRTLKILCEFSYLRLSAITVLAVVPGSIHAESSDTTIPRLWNEKIIILDSLRRRLRYLRLLHDISLEQSISSPPSCLEEKGRCMALLASH